MFKRLSVVFAAFFILVAFLVFTTMGNIKKGKAMGKMFAPQPAAVSTLVLKPQAWQPVLSAVGTLRAVNGTTLSTEQAGIVSKIGFESGTAVKKGDLLLELDTEQEAAQLLAEEAKRDFAKIDLTRKQDLIAKKANLQF